MLKNQTINLKVVERVATSLEELNDEVIYVGGAVVSLYVTDEGAEQPRPTKDVDISVQISSYSQMDRLREILATKKIYPATTETILYRFSLEDILIDFIPYEETSLGPTNRWLKPGFNVAYPVAIGKTEIKILPVSWFLATKWEAYKNRGNDPRTSHDFEDIIYVIDNNLNLVNETYKTDAKVKKFLIEICKEILQHPSRDEIIECHLSPFTMEERRKIIIAKLEKILVLK
jgi:predicted nucleotidyltransferase